MFYFQAKKLRNANNSFFLTIRKRNFYKTIMFKSVLEMLSRNYSRQIFSLPHTKNCKMFKLIPEWTALFSQHCYRLPIPSSLFLLSIKNLCSSKIRKRILLIFMSVQMTHTHEQTSKGLQERLFLMIIIFPKCNFIAF